jgi:hypothetical protein
MTTGSLIVWSNEDTSTTSADGRDEQAKTSNDATVDELFDGLTRGREYDREDRIVTMPSRIEGQYRLRLPSEWATGGLDPRHHRARQATSVLSGRPEQREDPRRHTRRRAHPCCS